MAAKRRRALQDGRPETNTNTHTHTHTQYNKTTQSGDDAGELRWFPLKDALGGKVAFASDHGEIVKDGAAWLEREGRAKGHFVEVDGE